jgi:CDP-diacylglycerol--serine O-phosphatidyltransferase
MKTIQKQIPNIITLLNLFCGCIALVMISNKDFKLAFFFVCLGIFLDFFDGFFARLLKVSSPLGLQLDSLADMITSGLVPGYTMYIMLASFDLQTNSFLPYLGFIITLGACYRLANFNIDTRQTDSFIGLPTPANALFILSLPLVLFYENCFFLLDKSVLLLIVFLSTFIMNAEIPLFSLKIKKMTIQDNLLPFGFLLYSLILLLILGFLAVPVIILSYVILSVVNNFLAKK